VFEHADEADAPANSRKRADAVTVIRAWRDGLDLVLFDGGGWVLLFVGWFE